MNSEILPEGFFIFGLRLWRTETELEQHWEWKCVVPDGEQIKVNENKPCWYGVCVCVCVPYEVEQGVGWAHDWFATVLRVLFLGHAPWVDDQNHDDADHHRQERGPEVVGDGYEA